MRTKLKLINDIKKIIAEHGSFNMRDVQNEESPIISIIGRTNEVADSFDVSGVSTTIYVDETETDNDYHFYEDLSSEVLESILEVCESYKTDNEKTMERCQS